MTRRPWLRAAVVALGIILGTAAAAVFLNSAPARKVSSADERLFVIQKGETLAAIAGRLAGEGYVRWPPLLELLARARGTDGAFKAGWYRIPAGATTLQVHDLLVAGSQSLEKLTIPEGWTIGRISRMLEERGICSAAAFSAAASSAGLIASLGVPAPSLEGWLFPDTYFVPRPFPAATLAELMVRNLLDQLDQVAPSWRKLAPAQLQEKLILASIVEREYRVADEAPLIASVFYNRLRLGIGLESCATVAYIITEIQNQPHPEYITLEDKGIDSPYNTYRWAGLPPGPIANPGRTALEAAFHPASTDYLYFVLQDAAAGRHHFSKDLDEHNQAKRLYLKK